MLQFSGRVPEIVDIHVYTLLWAPLNSKFESISHRSKVAWGFKRVPTKAFILTRNLLYASREQEYHTLDRDSAGRYG